MKHQKKQKQSFTQYVHEFIDEQGRRRWAVARWDDKNGEYYCPLSADERRANGGEVFAIVSRSLEYLGGYLNRQQALRRARYLFGQQNTDQN